MANFSNLFTPKNSLNSNLFKPQTSLNSNLFKPQTSLSSQLFSTKPPALKLPSVQAKPKVAAPSLIPKASASMVTNKAPSYSAPQQNNQTTIQTLMNQAKQIQSGLDQYSREQSQPQVQNQAPVTPAPQPLFQQSLERQMNIQPTDQQNQVFKGLMDKSNSPQAIEDARANLAKQMGMDINTNMGLMGKPGPLEFNQGRAQVAQQAQTQREAGLQGLLANLLTGRGQDISALGVAGGQANTQAQQQLTGLQNVAGLTKPEAQGYPFVFNPQTGEYTDASGGKYGEGILAKTNIQSAQDAQTQLNGLAQNAPAFQANFSRLVDTSKTIQDSLQKIGLSGTTPIVQGLNKLLNSTFANDPAVAQFQTLLQQVRAQWQQLMGTDPAVLDNATFDQLVQLSSTLQGTIQNRQKGLQDFISSGNTPTASPTQESTVTSGDKWSW